MSFFTKIMMGNYKTCPVITRNSFFFWRGNYVTPFFTAPYCLKPILHFKSSLLVCLYTSQTNKPLLNWVVLILIEQNAILKMRNQDCPPSKIEYIITLLKWLVRLILFLFLVVYRSTFKVVLTISRILFCKKPF